MDTKLVSKFLVFILVWLNAFLADHKLATIPVIDQEQIAVGLAFVYSAYEWISHAYKWVKKNWIQKQAAPAAQIQAQEPQKVVAAPITPAAPEIQPAAQPAAPTEPANTQSPQA